MTQLVPHQLQLLVVVGAAVGVLRVVMGTHLPKIGSPVGMFDGLGANSQRCFFSQSALPVQRFGPGVPLIGGFLQVP